MIISVPVSRDCRIKRATGARINQSQGQDRGQDVFYDTRAVDRYVYFYATGLWRNRIVAFSSGVQLTGSRYAGVQSGKRI